MKKIVLIYDDTVHVDDAIKTIIGNKSFGNIILKRKKLYSKIEKIIGEIRADIEFKRMEDKKSFEIIETYPKKTIFFHLLSNGAIINVEEFKIFLEKLKYVNEDMVIESKKTIGIVFTDRDKYIGFLKEYIQLNEFYYKCSNKVQTDMFLDLTDYNNLIMYISNGFDARYFNSIQGDRYTVTKRSKDKRKIKMEYSYYWLLPENMKNWMVMPYDYVEDKDTASYTMERMAMTDIAIRWTHNAIDIEEFRKLMDKVFYFINSRNERKISKEEYVKETKNLYIYKIEQRITKLKSLKEFRMIEKLIQSGTDYNSIDEILVYYKEVYEKVTKKYQSSLKFRSVIGHGDLFFANMLYNKDANLLRLIDPKGALEEMDLWINPYYDIAKLSHSICGNYDFFNVDGYNIELDKNMKFKLNIYFDNTKYKEIYKEYLEKSGYEYTLARLYESSLFLSMLPLHIDNLHKVIGFLLNAINILKEVEKDV